jgi:hypothetical protein
MMRMIPKEKKAVNSPYSDSLYFSSGALARQTQKLAKESWKPSGLHPSHGHLLLLILNSTFQNPGFFVNDLLLEPSTITRLMEKLEEKGLIKRFPYEHLIVARPTKKAYELMPVLEQCGKHFENRCHELLGKQRSYDLACVMNEATDRLS